MNQRIICLAIFVIVAASAAAESNIDWSKVYPRSALDDQGRLKENARPMSQTRNIKMVGGQEIGPLSHPYLAALFPYFGGLETIGFCQGSIISYHAVLTTANCVATSKKTEVRVGVHDVLLSSPARNSYLVHQGQYHIHPNYTKGYTNDIAVLTVLPNLAFSNEVKFIQLHYEDLTLDGKTATVIGWGSNRTPSAVTNTIAESYTCEKHFQEFFSNKHLCFNTFGKKGPCDVDNGAPMVYTDAFDGQIYLVGQFEFVEANTECNSEKPAAFTNIYSHIGDFISLYI